MHVETSYMRVLPFTQVDDHFGGFRVATKKQTTNT